jgi:hypothetical protein
MKQMERDDIALVTEGFIQVQGRSKERWECIEMFLSQSTWSPIRQYKQIKKDGFNGYILVNDTVEMNGSDFLRHLHMNPSNNTTHPVTEIVWESCDNKEEALPANNKSIIPFQLRDKKEEPTKDNKKFKALEVISYLADVNIEEKMSNIYSWYIQEFKMPEILPGGSLCMLKSVSDMAEGQSRPSIGIPIFCLPGVCFPPPHSFRLCLHATAS